ncbi:MAG: TonB-dependent receptor, partial [Bacteroidota bacterium]
PVEPGTPGAEEKFAGFERNFSNVSGGLGLSWQVAKPLFAKLNLARGFRAPNLSELSSNGKHEGTFRFEIGNRNLKPETSLQADAGLTFNSHHLTLEANGFFNQISHFIFLEKLESAIGGDSIPDPEDGSPAFQFVQGDARLFGGEIACDFHPHPWDWLHFQHSFSFVRGIQNGSPAGVVGGVPDSLRNLPFMPAPKLVSEIRAQREKPWRSLANLYTKLEGEWFFGQNHAFTAFGTETPTPGYFLLNAGFGAEFLNREKMVVCRLFFAAENLLNKQYVSHLSRLKYAPENLTTGEVGIFNPGRNFSLKVIFPMQF